MDRSFVLFFFFFFFFEIKRKLRIFQQSKKMKQGLFFSFHLSLFPSLTVKVQYLPKKNAKNHVHLIMIGEKSKFLFLFFPPFGRGQRVLESKREREGKKGEGREEGRGFLDLHLPCH